LADNYAEGFMTKSWEGGTGTLLKKKAGKRGTLFKKKKENDRMKFRAFLHG
jgi:hypothetical protein